MKKGVLLLFFCAAASVMAQLSVGIRIGPPPPPRIVRVRPVAPGPGYNWIDGYWYASGGRYRWHEGYWTRPPYTGAVWVTPRYEGGQFIEGYWSGEGHRPVVHDHRWDRDRRNRDYDRDHDRR